MKIKDRVKLNSYVALQMHIDNPYGTVIDIENMVLHNMIKVRFNDKQTRWVRFDDVEVIG